MDFEQLKIFISVVEHEGFTKAAESMNISHSTTSRNVSALEEHLGVELLKRDSRNIRMTRAGEILFREGRQLLQRVEDLKAAINKAEEGYSGPLSVVSMSLYSHKLASGYKEFCNRYPDIELGIYKRELSDVFGMVSSGKIDLGASFSYALPENMGIFEKRVAETEKFCVIAPPSHPLSLRKNVRLNELRSVNYVSIGEQRSAFMRKLESPLLTGRSKSEILSVPTLESLFLQVSSGNGISLVPYPIAYEYGSDCAVLDVDDLDSSFDIVIFWRKDNENPTLPLLVDIVTRSTDQGR